MPAKFTEFTSHVVPLAAENVDTDQIIPARFLKVTDKNGLGTKLFNDWRYKADGSDNPDFVLNEPASKGAQVLLAGDNFGCGSSREHAPWALVAWGFRTVISTSFADIFQNNALKNGLLPVVVEPKVLEGLFAAVRANRKAEVSIDLPSQTLTLPDGSKVTFPVDDFAKHCLVHGTDELGYILSFEERIAAYEGDRA
ncbi:MAG: 3-isopropylmalate dehydratase small subunit [Myxococcales bacterium]|nr:3-isopropylmalate dehydratase small subunit [Myxococcales bacterium]